MKTIWKAYKDNPDDWFEIDEQDFIEDTEGHGYWKPGTALRTLKDIGFLRTAFVIYEWSEKPTDKEVKR